MSNSSAAAVHAQLGIGYFRDGGTQPWVHKREVFIAYEAWARAKGVATGMIR